MVERDLSKSETPAQSAILEFDGVSKAYGEGDSSRRVLSDVSFQISKSTTVSVTGRSGSGKSTLLNLAAGIDVPSHGRVSVAGQDLSGLRDRERTLVRRHHIGLVFQFFHLLEHLSVVENIILPELIAGRSSDYDERAQQLLERVGLADRSHDNIGKLSGGEMQRVAICRALIRRPSLILADEPTGNLDDENSRTVMNLMLRLVKDEESSLVFVTHSAELAALADERWSLRGGRLLTQ